MNNVRKTRDRRMVLLEALLRYADQSGSINPQFHKDDMLKMLNVCEVNFDIMHKQLGDKYCRMIDGFEMSRRYSINVIECLDLRDKLIRNDMKEKSHHRKILNIMLAASWGTFFVVLLGNCIR